MTTEEIKELTKELDTLKQDKKDKETAKRLKQQIRELENESKPIRKIGNIVNKLIRKVL